MFALVIDQKVFELFDEDPHFAESFSVIDVSAFPEVAVGWVVADDGSVSAPPEISPVVMVPTSVSARQFKLQLLAADILDQVEAWVATQSKAVQIAYASSGSFVRAEPMMATGFAELNFTDEQVDSFFIAAANL